MEKYRYRRKADEIRDAEIRQRELIHRATNDWRVPTSAPTSYLDSLSSAHKERLISSLNANLRGTTPERLVFLYVEIIIFIIYHLLFLLIIFRQIEKVVS